MFLKYSFTGSMVIFVIMKVIRDSSIWIDIPSKSRSIAEKEEEGQLMGSWQSKLEECFPKVPYTSSLQRKTNQK